MDDRTAAVIIALGGGIPALMARFADALDEASEAQGWTWGMLAVASIDLAANDPEHAGWYLGHAALASMAARNGLVWSAVRQLSVLARVAPIPPGEQADIGGRLAALHAAIDELYELSGP